MSQLVSQLFVIIYYSPLPICNNDRRLCLFSLSWWQQVDALLLQLMNLLLLLLRHFYSALLMVLSPSDPIVVGSYHLLTTVALSHPATGRHKNPQKFYLMWGTPVARSSRRLQTRSQWRPQARWDNSCCGVLVFVVVGSSDACMICMIG